MRHSTNVSIKHLINNSHFLKNEARFNIGLLLHQVLTNFCSAFGYHLDYYQRDSKATVSYRHFTLNVPCVPIIPTFGLCSHRHLGTLTNRSSKKTSQRHAKQSGAVEACWAHNPEVRGSKPRSAIFIFISKKMPYFPPKSVENADRTCANSRIFVILGIPRIFRLYLRFGFLSNNHQQHRHFVT